MDINDAQQPSSSGLRQAAITGVRWLMLGRVGSDAAQFVAAVALARLITPAEFGHAAVALIIVPLSAILTFEGFGSALVQRKQVTSAHVETATLASVVAGLVLSGVVLAGSQLVAAPLFGERTAALIELASPLFFVTGLSAVSRSLLWRKLEFRAVTLIETASMAVGAGASVLLALHGLEGEAIILGAICGAVVSTVLMLILVRPARPRWHGRELREIVGFGGPASGAGMLYVATTNVDYTIVAMRLSAAQTGFYWRAFQLGVVYQDKISGIMARLAFPIYSRTKDLAELRRLHERATRVHAAVVVPLLAVLIVTAPLLVPWLFGPVWEPAVLPSQILAVAGMIAAVLTGYPQVLLAAGRPKELMRFNVGLLVGYGGVVWLTAPYGIVAVAIGVVGVHVGMLVVVYGILLRRVVGVPVDRMVGDLAPAVAGSVALLAVGFPLAALMESLGAPAPVIVAAVGLVGLTVHALVLRTLFGAVWRDLVSLALRVAPARPGARRRQPVVPSAPPA
jgi:O-antigen/teichoic acid export membrane protein